MMLTPTQIEATYPPEVVDAWWWLDIHCRHYATLHADQQTLGALNTTERLVADAHLETLRNAGLLRPGAFYKGNFIKEKL